MRIQWNKEQEHNWNKSWIPYRNLSRIEEISHSNITSFSRLVNKRASYPFGIISLADASALIGRRSFILTFAENVAHNLCCQWKSQSHSPTYNLTSANMLLIHWHAPHTEYNNNRLSIVKTQLIPSALLCLIQYNMLTVNTNHGYPTEICPELKKYHILT
jgi:hypothetical protein